ncbi:MAG: hypothetical protein LC750_03395, partial [Actinobacteria bacterium]|nr:hypothetical protein [Actinomycetota bacterium]
IHAEEVFTRLHVVEAEAAMWHAGQILIRDKAIRLRIAAGYALVAMALLGSAYTSIMSTDDTQFPPNRSAESLPRHVDRRLMAPIEGLPYGDKPQSAVLAFFRWAKALTRRLSRAT